MYGNTSSDKPAQLAIAHLGLVSKSNCPTGICSVGSCPNGPCPNWSLPPGNSQLANVGCTLSLSPPSLSRLCVRVVLFCVVLCVRVCVRE